MKVINTKVHGILDYAVAVILIASPWLLNFASGGAETTVAIALGAATIFYSIITRYELGLVKLLSFRFHLTIDALSGVLLAASPWLFGFAHKVYLPHLVFGLLEIGVVVLSKKYTSAESEKNTKTLSF